LNIHIDVYSAQTGVSRFLELSPNWKYNKTEGLPRGGNELQSFTHLLVGTELVEDRLTYFNTHDILVSQDGFSGIDFSFRRVPPVQIKSEPKVIVLKKKSFQI